jgi:hypothetical protein
MSHRKGAIQECEIDIRKVGKQGALVALAVVKSIDIIINLHVLAVF